MSKDIVHGFYHKDMDKEIKRVLLQCRQGGLFINIKLATAIVSEKSRRGVMTIKEIKDYVNKILLGKY